MHTKIYCKKAVLSCLLLVAVLHSNTSLFAQKTKPDSSYIKGFDKQQVLEIHPGLYHTTLNFTREQYRKRSFRFVANSSGYAGIYVSYKWLSFKYSWVIPGSRLDNNAKLKYLSLGYHFTTSRFCFHPFYDSYNGLLIPAAKRRGNVEVFKEIQLKDAGFDFTYIINNRKFSYKAATSFSELQLRSAGSFLFDITPIWQRLKWYNPSRSLIRDSVTYNLLVSNPAWYSVVPKFGYIHNFTWHAGRWSIAPQLLLGAGGIKETHPGQKNLQLVTNIQGILTAGYNGANFYVYLNGYWDKQHSNLFIEKLEETNIDISLVVGYRFNALKKKILGIL